MKSLVKLLVVATFAVVTAGVSSEAHADFKIRLDNSSNPADQVYWAGTPDDMLVCVWFSWFEFHCWDAEPIETITGNNDFDYDGAFNADDVIRIDVSIDGDNAFWLDQIELFTLPGMSRVWFDGADNLGGWCISTDPNDGNNANCDDDAAQLVIWAENDGLPY